jgi:hypothetical protein
VKGSRNDRWVRRAGFVLGLAGAAAVLAAARVPAQPRDLGADVELAPVVPKALTLKPQGPLLSATGLRAGAGGATDTATLMNPTPRTQRVRLRARPSTRALDRSLRIEVKLDGATLYSGPLGGLRRPSATSLALASGDGLPLKLRVWIPPGATGWRGRIEDVNLAFDAVPVP